ncbi:hypothetical protein [Lysobacter soli]|uniref:Uncharacterized protein n=1 Tax=Lysobacter soli TaxID=453783 RepID=A0A3D8VH36_9GAMM|nr:hypothetical protein [Lysobacter soli]RDY68645.1 hypothetical protein DX912_03840 [Lysobacter soli]
MAREQRLRTPAARGIWGLCLLCLGAFFLYGSLDVIQHYFATGHISWGSSPRQVTGEMALMQHGIGVLAGAWMSAEGVRQIVFRNAG